MATSRKACNGLNSKLIQKRTNWYAKFYEAHKDKASKSPQWQFWDAIQQAPQQIHFKAILDSFEKKPEKSKTKEQKESYKKIVARKYVLSLSCRSIHFFHRYYLSACPTSLNDIKDKQLISSTVSMYLKYPLILIKS